MSLALGVGHLSVSPPFFIAALMVPAAGGADPCARCARCGRRARRFAWALVLVCAVVLLAEAPTWFAPPVGGDQTKYQLAYPRLFAMAGGIVPTPWCFWGSQQWLQNFLFALAYAVHGEDLARCMNAAEGVLAALALATPARRHLARRPASSSGARGSRCR